MTEPQNPPEHAAKRAIDDITLDLGRVAPPATHGQRPEWSEPHGSELRIQTRGRWLTISGITGGLLTFALAAVWRHGHGTEMPLTYVLPLYALSLGAIAIGCLEYLHRPTRETHQLCLEQIAGLERGLVQLVDLMDEELKQRWYRGFASSERDHLARTGTDNTRPADRDRGEVIRFRQRNRDN